MPIPAILYYGGLGALRAAPAIMRAGSAGLKAIRGGGIQRGLKNYFRGTKGKFPLAPGAQGPTVPGTAPGIVRPGRFGSNYITQAGLGYGAYNYLTDNAEQSVEDQKNQGGGGDNKGGPVDTVPDPVTPKKKPPPDGGASGLDDDIKKGNLDDFIKERMDLFDKYLGDSKGQLKNAAFASLTEFGLNLAQARGGNLMDKIARSAKDPLKTFTAIGMAAKDRADKIKMAAVESGIEAQEAALDRAGDTDGTTFQKNLSTLQAMFTNKDGELTIPQEDLINMAKAGGTTSRKDFLATFIPSLITSQNPNTGQAFTPEEAAALAEQTWSQISGEEPPPSKGGQTTTNTTGDPLGIM